MRVGTWVVCAGDTAEELDLSQNKTILSMEEDKRVSGSEIETKG